MKRASCFVFVALLILSITMGGCSNKYVNGVTPKVTYENSILTNEQTETVSILVNEYISPPLYEKISSTFLFLENTSNIKHAVLYLNSGGGDVFAAMAICDLLMNYKDKGWTIDTHGTGLIASATVAIFMCGENRIATENTTFMIHRAQLNGTVKNENIMMGLIHRNYINILKSSGLTSEEILKLMDETTWFDAKQALEWGFVTKIQ